MKIPPSHVLSNRRLQSVGLAAVCAVFLPVLSASAQVISIDFGDNAANDNVVTPSETLGVDSVDNWNAVAAATASGISLNDDTGVASGADLNLTAHGSYYLQYANNSTPEGQMYRTYLDSGGIYSGTSTLAFSGLTYSLVDVVVYFDGATGGATRNGSYTVSSGTGTAVPFSEELYGQDVDANEYTYIDDSTYVNATSTVNSAATTAGNYVEFTDVPVINGDLTLTANGDGYASDGVSRSPINGLQIIDVVSAPEPSTYALMLGGLAVLLAVHRVRRLGTAHNS